MAEPTEHPLYPGIIKTEVTLAGNPSVGTVTHLAVHHQALAAMDRDELEILGARWLGVLVRLRELNVRHCFLEGWSVDTDIKASLASKEPNKDFERAFPDHELPRRLTEEQAILVARHFSHALQHFFPDMKLYGTESPTRDFTRMIHPNTPREERRTLVYEDRERQALDKILQVMAGSDLNNQAVALVYGANHTWGPNHLPDNIGLEDAPVIIKETFEPWSPYHWTEQLLQAATAEEQRALINPNKRYNVWVWSRLHTVDIQRAVFPLLMANPDYYESPDKLRYSLTLTIKSDDPKQKEDLTAEIESSCRDSSGPFAYLSLRPGCEQVMEDAKGEFASVSIYEELHPYTQLQLVKSAPFLKLFCFGKIITAIGQMTALPKLRLDTDQPLTDALDLLLWGSVNNDVKNEILRRARAGESPFTAPMPVE